LWPWLAAQANLRGGGTPLSSREYREVFRRFVRADRHRKGATGILTFREMATAALAGARGADTISNWIKADFPDIYAAIRSGELSAMRAAESLLRNATGTAPIDLAIEAVEKAGACARELASPADRCRVATALRALADELEA
jgi:hypothetical protein